MKNMDLNMKTFEEVNLSHKSILKKIYSGGKLNWIFLAGGPGLGEEYLADFLIKNSPFKNTVYVLKYPQYNNTLSDEEILLNLELDVKEALNKLDNVILLGHSFGGMLLQSINLDKNDYKKLILLSSSPNLECFNVANNNYNLFTLDEKKTIETLDELYSNQKNNKNFKLLFKSWAPFYVKSEYKNSYIEMIENCSVDYEFYEWGNRFFNNYFEKNGVIPKNTTAINSKNDNICPSSLFFNSRSELHDFIELDGSAHFPWIENTQSLLSLLQKIEG